MELELLHAEADKAAELLSAIANSKRVMILCNLVANEITVGALAEKVGLSQSALSQHLSKLRAMDLVTTRRDAQTIYYSCDNPKVTRILETLSEISKEELKDRSAA